jgi:hypothetical protein
MKTLANDTEVEEDDDIGDYFAKMLLQFGQFSSPNEVNLKINPFGRTFDNIEIKDLYQAVKSKTNLENSSRYESSKLLEMRASSISSIGQFKLITSQDHLNPVEPLQ